jgi:hypothetical protein|tara:strand:+ start:50427 stop:50633 length:207 start_codon:yes stop_codon:yes gene_type:complete
VPFEIIKGWTNKSPTGFYCNVNAPSVHVIMSMMTLMASSIAEFNHHRVEIMTQTLAKVQLKDNKGLRP